MERIKVSDVPNNMSRILTEDEEFQFRGPRMVTHHGKDIGVLLPLRLWEKLDGVLSEGLKLGGKEAA